MIRASFYGTAFLSGIAVGAGIVGGVVGIAKLAAACRSETSHASELPAPVEVYEPVPPKKPRASKRGKGEAHASRKPSSEPDPHRAKSWKN
jgi:hypothetical protein